MDLNFSYRICLEVARKIFSREHDEGEWYDIEAERHDMESAAREAAKEAEERRKKLELIELMVAGLFLLIGVILWSFVTPLLGIFSDYYMPYSSYSSNSIEI